MAKVKVKVKTTLELTDPLIEGLLGHPTIPKLFPVFKPLADAKKQLAKTVAERKCQKCVNRDKRAIVAALYRLKNELVRMSADQKALFKRELRAEQVRITVTSRAGGKIHAML